MIEIGGMPIVWHIMKIFGQQGFNNFILTLGYKGRVIKDFFVNQNKMSGDLHLSIKKNKNLIIQENHDKWDISMIETGLNTNTGGRIKRLKKYVDNTFMCTYGDGVSNIDLKKLISFHKKKKKLATITVVRPRPRFGLVSLNDGLITKFAEKKNNSKEFINGGFMVLEKKILDLIENENTSLEFNTLKYLSSINQLAGYIHEDFWECMDTKRDLDELESLWDTNNAPWKIWE